MNAKDGKVTLDDLVNPIHLMAFWGEDRLYKWQADIVLDVWGPGSRIIGTFPNEAGKTSIIIANLGLAFMSAFPGGQVVSTAGSFRQISEQLWPVVKGKVNKYPEWSIKEDKLTAPSVRGLRPSTWTIFSTDDEKKAEGYHTQYDQDDSGKRVIYPILYIIDEAKTVDSGIFQAMYRCDPDHALVVSSPGEEDGEFYEMVTACRHDRDSIWKLYEVSWSDCPHLMEGRKKKVREDLIKRFGQNHPLIQSMIFGKFYRSGAFYIFRSEDIESSMGGTIPFVPGHRRGASDISGGGDEITFMCRDGNTLMESDGITEKDTAKSSRWLEEKFRKWELRPQDITIDEGGIGQAIIDELEYRGWRGIRRYNFDASPKDKTKYDSLAMEHHYELSLAMSAGEINLLKDDILKSQMRDRRFTMPNKLGGLMSLESKKIVRKRNKYSPDRLDTLIMLYSTYARSLPQAPQDRKYSELYQKWAKQNRSVSSGRQDPVGHMMARRKERYEYGTPL